MLINQQDQKKILDQQYLESIESQHRLERSELLQSQGQLGQQNRWGQQNHWEQHPIKLDPFLQRKLEELEQIQRQSSENFTQITNTSHPSQNNPTILSPREQEEREQARQLELARQYQNYRVQGQQQWQQRQSSENFTQQYTSENSPQPYPHRADCKYNKENFAVESKTGNCKTVLADELRGKFLARQNDSKEEILSLKNQILQKNNAISANSASIARAMYRPEIERLQYDRNFLINELNQIQMKLTNITSPSLELKQLQTELVNLI